MLTNEMPSLPFQIKICGVTSVEDAQAVVRAGADAIGLNFYPRSKRLVNLELATLIGASVPSDVTKVGVFVNSTIAEIRETVSSVGLDLIQLHGDEPTEMISQLAGLSVIRALRWGPDGSASADRFLDRCDELGCQPFALLVDAYHQSEYGGTGTAADWAGIANWKAQRGITLPIVLAGGLTVANVAAAIATVKPAAIDTASGVESLPGRKDAKMIADYVAAARRTFASL